MPNFTLVNPPPEVERDTETSIEADRVSIDEERTPNASFKKQNEISP